MMNKINFTTHTGSYRGFSLIEVMVALALGALLMLGVTEIFTNNSQTRAEIERVGQQMESGAYALRVIESELSNAAYWGETGEQTTAAYTDRDGSSYTASQLPPVCPGLGANITDAAGQLRAAMAYPVQGQDQSGSSCISPCTASATDDDICIKAGTDFIAIRRASSCAFGDGGCSNGDSNFHMQVNACFDADNAAVPLPGEILIDTDKTALIYTRRGNSCPSGTLAPRYQFLSHVYYVNENDVLVRARLDRSTSVSDYTDTPLVDGVEAMKLEYGLDTSGNGQVNINVTTPTVAQWTNVVMVRISLVLRNLNPTPGYIDTRVYTLAGATYTVPTAFLSYKRQVYTRTVSLRNVGGRREVQ